MNNQELLVINDSARFFFGATYFDERKYKIAEHYFKREIANRPSGVWINSEYRFLAESLIAQGKIEEGKNWLGKATSHGAKARLRNMELNIKPSFSTPFISY